MFSFPFFAVTQHHCKELTWQQDTVWALKNLTAINSAIITNFLIQQNAQPNSTLQRVRWAVSISFPFATSELFPEFPYPQVTELWEVDIVAL